MAQSQVALGFPAGSNEWIETTIGAAAEQIKASGGTLYLFELDNTANGALTYVKFFFAAVGSVTVGTTVPDLVYPFPAGIKLDVFPVGGQAYATALTVAAVTTGGTAGTTPPVSAAILRVVYA